MEKDIVKTFIAMGGGTLTWVLGAWDTPLRVLICFITLDYITGILRGYIYKEISSDIGLKGIARKALIFIVLIVAVMLDRLVNNGSLMFRSMISYFYIANEGISILENLAVIGLPIPESLKNALIQLKKTNKQSLK